ncbi:MAG: PDZ domain-containing protein [Planctomycetales bacterium]|nr:PDZ domain-containing protein [Planctomycetales bacterium]
MFTRICSAIVVSVAVVGLFQFLVGGGRLLIAQERKTRDTLVREDLQNVVADGHWIYNDLDVARRQARLTGKPMLVVIRCIPCEACAQLDSEIVDRDPLVQKQLSEFICVRIVQANGLDLQLFQYDYDQSFAAFFMNGDNTIYGRYGTRSHQTESEDDVALEGFSYALDEALTLHRAYPDNAKQLAGKQTRVAPAFTVPEEYPLLKGRYTDRLNYDGEVAKSCIHCHQLGEAIRDDYWRKHEPIPTDILFSYPHPKTLGLIIDPKTCATVKGVVPGSAAEKAGFQVGDRITTFDDQPVLSIADLQWVLHHASSSNSIRTVVRRGEQERVLQLALADGWRERGDISWRATSWSLRRMTTGGMKLQELDDEQRRELGLDDNAMGLRVEHLGQYGAHALAKNSGFQQGDVLVAVDGDTTVQRESDLFARLIRQHQAGDEVPFTVLRDGNRLDLPLKMQE